MVVECKGKRTCIGLDKIGHFFEEGLAYYDIAITHGYGLDYAIAWGEWTEGIIPFNMDTEMWDFLHNGIGEISFFMAGGNISMPGLNPGNPTGDWFGHFGDSWPGGKPMDPNGFASPADLAANLAGFHFIEQLFQNGKPGKFDICDHVTDEWDHIANPNNGGSPRHTIPDTGFTE